MQIRVAETKTALWVQATEVVKEKFRRSYSASVEPNPQYFAVLHSRTTAHCFPSNTWRSR